MSFISPIFLLFLAASIVVYYCVPAKHRWIVLLIASYVFYCWNGIAPIAYMLLTTLTTWAGALFLDKLRKSGKQATKNKELTAEQKKAIKEKNKRQRRLLFWLVLLLNLGILVVLKYLNAAAESLTSLWGRIIGGNVVTPTFQLLVPLGISFYTFQAVGYLIDVYNGKYAAEENPCRFALFVSFFPQIVQGPIGRYDDLGEQLREEKHFQLESIKSGAILMLWGFFKKMVIADRMAPLVNAVFEDPRNAQGGIVIVLGILFYALQLYADFSAGIDIVSGAAEMFGIRLAPNFKQPYFAVSLGDFWRRWHISLGAWMRDYVFYPLAVSKPISNASKAFKKRNLHLSRALPAVVGNIVVFLIVGAWHGSQWRYVFWGLYNGVILAVSALLEPAFDAFHKKFPRLRKSAFWHIFCVIRTFVIVCIGYYFDCCRYVGDAFYALYQSIAAPNFSLLSNGIFFEFGPGKLDYLILAVAWLIVFAVSLAREKGIKIRQWLYEQNTFVRWTLLYILLFFFITFAVTGIDAMEGFMYEVF